jgi:chromosome partitioning protein
MAYIITIANEKGGVAKTTTAISLGASLAEANLKVLLIDLDAQFNLTLATGLEISSIQKTITNVILESQSIAQAIYQTSVPGVDVIPSNHEMVLAERFLPIRTGYEGTLRKTLQEVQSQYDFILLDCPPFLGAITLNALVASNLLLIPTQPEYFSVYALRNLMSIVRRVRSQYNAKLTYRLLITMFDKRNRSHRTMLEQLQSTFASGLFETLIQIDTKLRESPIAGVPITSHAPSSRAALQYRALAQEIIEYAKEKTIQPT